MGELAEDVLALTDISADDWKNFQSITAKFNSFFRVRKNVIFKHACFNCRSQGEGESAEEFITNLYQLVKNCNYSAMHDQMIHNRIVVGIRDQALSQWMQMDPVLTLEKAKTLTQQRKAMREQQERLPQKQPYWLTTCTIREAYSSHLRVLLQGLNLPSQVLHEMWERPPSMPPVPYWRCTVSQMQAQRTLCCPLPLEVSCWRRRHPSTRWGVRWHCLPQHSGLARRQLRTCDMQVNRCDVTFKVDTGAKLTVTPEDVRKALGLNWLTPSTKKLHGPDHSPLEVVGQAKVRLS